MHAYIHITDRHTHTQIGQMHTLADAAKEAGVKHVVFSSLDYCTKVLEEKGITSIPKIGKFCVPPHYDTKGTLRILMDCRMHACMCAFMHVCVYVYVCMHTNTLILRTLAVLDVAYFREQGVSTCVFIHRYTNKHTNRRRCRIFP